MVSSWIPDALRELGASDGSAYSGALLTAAWAKLPVFVPLGAIVYGFRQRPAPIDIAAVTLSAALLELIQSTEPLGLPWALIGHSQIDITGVAQWAALGGVPLVSALVVALNVSAADLVDRRAPNSIRWAASCASVWGVLALTGLPIAKSLATGPASGQPVNVLIVQPNIPRAERWVEKLQLLNVERIASATRRALESETDRIDAVVWPENLVTTPVDTAPDISSAITSATTSFNTPLIAGVVRTGSEANRYRSSVVWWSAEGEIVASMDKERAVPIVEAAVGSSVEKWLSSYFGGAATGPRVEVSNAGPDLSHDFAFTPALCWEALLPDLIDRRRTQESRVILNLADDSWVENTGTTVQLATFARFRAIEQRLPLIRVAHGGLSMEIDRYGQIVQALPLDEYASMVVSLPPASHNPFVAQVALFFIPVSAGFIVCWTCCRSSRFRMTRSFRYRTVRSPSRFRLPESPSLPSTFPGTSAR